MISSESLEIFRTAHWSIRHSADTAIPGYVILFSNHPSSMIGDLPPEASRELGPLLKHAATAVEKVIQPERVYVCLFNETRSAVHFHVFPRMKWMTQCDPVSSADPSQLLDGGVVFSAARKVPNRTEHMEPAIFEAAAEIRKLVAEAIRANPL